MHSRELLSFPQPQGCLYMCCICVVYVMVHSVYVSMCFCVPE